MWEKSLKGLGHTTLALDSQNGGILFQPFFARRYLWCQRQTTITPDFAQLNTTRHVFFAHAARDRFDPGALKYFYQDKTTVYIPKSLEDFFGKFFRFTNCVILKNHAEIQLGDVKILPLVTQTKVWRFCKWHNEALHFVVTTPTQTSLILSEIPTKSEDAPWMSFQNIETLFVPINKLSLASFYKKPAEIWRNLFHLFNQDHIKTIIPYAFDCYAKKPEEPTQHQIAFESFLASHHLTHKLQGSV